MPDFEKFIREREAFADRYQKLLEGKIRSLQYEMYLFLIDRVISVLEADSDGKIKFTTANTQKASKVIVAVREFNQERNKSFLSWLFRRLGDLFGLNRRYFSSFANKSETIDERVRRRLLLRYGYDTNANAIVPGGYLSALSTNDSIALDAYRFIKTALGTMSERKFKKEFRKLFIKPGGLGIVERYYNTFVRDLFMEFDRETQHEYADEIGLKHAIFSGTAIETSRHFCLKRKMRIYTLEEINSWNSENWQGKRPGVDVKIALGGYNCRDHLSFISEALAKSLEDQYGEINSFNPL